MRKDEQFARSTFDRHLKALGLLNVRWRAGRNPPDYYIRAGSLSFAVEVTQIMESVDLGTHRVTERGAQAALSALEAEIEAAAREAGTLNGSYALHLSPIPNLRAARPSILRRALDYIDRTRNQETADAEVIAPSIRGRGIRIQKIQSSTTLVGSITSIGGAKWRVEVQHELTSLLTTAVDRKVTRLRRVRLPKVLLLVDAYSYAESTDWATCSAACGLEAFHTVARTHGTYECQILLGREPLCQAAA